MIKDVQRPGAASRQILLVENELMVALEMEVAIREAGLCEVRIAGNEAAAREIVAETDCLSGAILDVNLSDGTSLGLAEDLIARGVPVAFATGYDSSAQFLARFPEAPVINKPFGKNDLVSAVAWLLEVRGGTCKSA